MRYVAIGGAVRPRSDWEDGDTHQVGTTVHETDDGPVDTGLLSAAGVRLYRVREKIPFGFVKG
jgi:hypothetical protein